MAPSHIEKREGGPLFWICRAARGLAARPGRLVRVHGPHGQGRGGPPQGGTAAPPPLLGLELMIPALDGWAGGPSHPYRS
jgi:hypothetical protein